MRRCLFIIVLATSLVATGQNYKKILVMGVSKQWENAKVELDNVLKDSKAENKAETYFWKAKIYSVFFKDSALSIKYPNALEIASEAYWKYQKLDKDLKILKEYEGQDLLFNIYTKTFNEGITAFNESSKKKSNWEVPMKYFDYAAKFSDEIFKNKFSGDTLAKMDTISWLYAGYSAQNAQKVEDAFKYYDKLINANVKGNNYIDIYKYVLYQSILKKDQTLFNKYLTKAKKIYPKENWEDYESEFFDKNFNAEQKLEYYNAEEPKGSFTAKKYLEFGSYFIASSKDEKEVPDSIKRQLFLDKSLEAFKKAYEKDPKEVIAPFNVGITFYNRYVSLDDQSFNIRKKMQELNTAKTKASNDPKKKATADESIKKEVNDLKLKKSEVDNATKSIVDTSIVWLEKSFAVLENKTELNKTEKSCISTTVDKLSILYQYKRDKTKGVDPTAYDIYEAKFKKFDALHDKWK